MLGGVDVAALACAGDLGVTLDLQLSIKHHFNSVA